MSDSKEVICDHYDALAWFCQHSDTAVDQDGASSSCLDLLLAAQGEDELLFVNRG